MVRLSFTRHSLRYSDIRKWQLADLGQMKGTMMGHVTPLSHPSPPADSQPWSNQHRSLELSQALKYFQLLHKTPKFLLGYWC